MSETSLRRAAPADLPGLVDRWRELMAAHAELHPTLYALAPHAAETYAATLRRQMADPACLVLVATAAPPPGGPVVGGPAPLIDGFLSAGVGLRAPIYAHREVGMIFDLAVRPDMRRRGLGRALLGTADAWFGRKGVTLVQVDFAPGNARSTGFWRAQGFEVLLSEAYRTRA